MIKLISGDYQAVVHQPYGSLFQLRLKKTRKNSEDWMATAIDITIQEDGQRPSMTELEWVLRLLKDVKSVLESRMREGVPF